MKAGAYFTDKDELLDLDWYWESLEGLVTLSIRDDQVIARIEVDELIALGAYFQKLKELKQNDKKGIL